MPGIENAVVGMGTDYNLDSLKRLDMFLPEFKTVTPSDLIICVKAVDENQAREGVATAERLLSAKKTKACSEANYVPPTQEAAEKMFPEANVSLISVPGAYAARETEIALDKGRHVMLFSDNVTIEEELKLKEIAERKGLLVMGPDCGTAIINNVPLAFANVVKKGDIGLVAASGTGLQEVTSIISRLGFGITQAIGVGGRDLSEKIGGKMTIMSALALAGDAATKVIVLISKPPHPKTLDKLYKELKSVKKPIVIYFIGADPETISKAGFVAAANLEDAAIKACELSGKKEIEELIPEKDIAEKAKKLKLSGKFLRGLYSGGTLCDEAQRLLQPMLGEIYSNTPVKGCLQLADVYKSEKHCIVDLGDDEFTRGKAHPMIDPSFRQERIEIETADTDVGMIIFDVVLGFGSHADMASEMVAAIEKARGKSGRDPVFAAVLCGTYDDPQNYNRQKETLENAGVIVFPSNVSLVKFTQKCFMRKKTR